MNLTRLAVLLLITLGICSCGKFIGSPVWEPNFIVGKPGDFGTPSIQPLTEQDRISVRDGHFYAGPKGKTSEARRVRFFGVNLALSANFPSPEEAEKLSRRLESLGVNIVRLHAIDQQAGPDPKRPNGVLVNAKSPNLDPEAIRLLDQLIEKLNNRGIYVDLNLHVNHTFPASIAGEFIPPQSKPIHIFDRVMIEWQKQYVKNIASALHLKDRPGLALVEISNESTLLDNWQENRLPSLVKGEFYSELSQEWSSYKRSHSEIDENATLPLGRSGLTDSQARMAAEFFLSLDKCYITEMSNVVRAAIGDDVAISGTQIIHSGRWKHGGFANFEVNDSAGYVDAHFYVDHYYFPRRQWDWNDWMISNNWVGDSLIDTISNVAFARYAGKPFVISEFNQPWPNERESGILPVITQFASAQDWDGLILYTYAHDRDWDSPVPSDFSLRGDWTKLVQFRQCAEYFKNGFSDVALPEKILKIGRYTQISGAVDDISGELLKYLMNNFGVTSTLAFQNRIGMVGDKYRGTSSERSLASSSYMSYERGRRQITFGSSYSAGFSGYLEDRGTVNSSIMTLTRNPGDSEFITAFLTSQDGLPLERSRHMLLTLPGATYGSEDGAPLMLQRVFPAAKWWTIPSKNPAYPSGDLYRVAKPVWMERVKIIIKLRLSAKEIVTHTLDEYGRRTHDSKIKVVNGMAELHANDSGDLASPAFEIEVVN